MPTRELVEGHLKFKNYEFAPNKEIFLKLANKGQSPKVLWIGCSDSRVVPEQITGARPGDLFIMRNIANIVPPSEAASDASGAVIEYAVLHLKVSHIVVCGHTECGGIAALSGPVDASVAPHIARWIEWARPAGAQVVKSGIPESECYLSTIKANILLQCENLHSHGCVREGVAAGTLATHAWLYDIHEGEILAHDARSNSWVALQAAYRP